MQRILITGSSSGFGFLAAQTLTKAGHVVFATMRDPAGRNSEAAARLTESSSQQDGRLHVLDLDVTSDASVEAAVEQANELEGGIDVLVNNAGFGGGGLTETFTPAQFSRMFEVNVFGVQRMNRAVLPAMRQRGSGLLIHISSTMGRIVIPFAGAYTATKFALEGLSETYRYELAPHGIESVIIQPGGFGTDFFGSMLQPEDAARVETYGEAAAMPQQLWSGMGEMIASGQAPDPQIVADAILEVISAEPGARPARMVVDPMTGGEGPKALNQTAAAVQEQLLSGFGMESLLHVAESSEV
ncbi:MAG: SDR family oxidoreductase [Rhodothermales bacterium]|nr:SDR family oxidoreductase [Rhodothermales bacterium]MBO6780333.1 SDR family oxidoreductase [Rhodothermales bacterium]